MKWGNKKISFLSFNFFEEERLEEYLNEEADKGWLLKKINNLYITFEKTDRKNFKYNVTSNSKYSYMNEKEYKNRCEEYDMEYICGNNMFQIAILNKENENKIKSEVNIKEKLKYDFYRLINLIILCFVGWDITGYKTESYLLFISENERIALFICALIVILFSIKYVIFDAIWNINYFFRKKTKTRDLRKIKTDSKILTVASLIALVILIYLFINMVITLFDNNIFSEASSNSKENLPLRLEDFNIKIEEERESLVEKNDSLFASYYTYYDYTSYAEYSKKDDAPSVETFSDKISYEVFTSKYENIMKEAINVRLNSVDYTFDDYEKSTKGREVELWGAKSIYTNKDTKEKIIVYDDKFLYLDMDINYDDKNITLIKNKLLNL